MDKQKWEEVVRHVIPWVFEEGAFMFSEVAGRDMFDARESDLVKAELFYRGAQAGNLILATQGLFAVHLAANMLGRDPFDAFLIPLADDAVGEILNMLAGNLLANLYGTTADIDIGMPKVTRANSSALQKDMTRMSFSCMFRNEDKELFLLAFKPNVTSPSLGNR